MRRTFSLLIILFLLIGVCSQVYAGQLELTGTVAGYERLFGHIYNSKKVHNRFFLVKIDKINKGTTDSEYLLVNYLWRLEDKDTPIDRDIATQWNFSLSRDKTCDRSMRDAQYVYNSSEGKITGVEPRFVKTNGVDINNLRFDKMMPCYQLKRGNFSSTGSLSRSDNSGFFQDQFLLEKALWKNYEGSPIKIRVTNRMNLALENVSDRQILKYKIGCVHDEANKISDVLEENEELTPSNIMLGNDDVLRKQVKTCYDQNAFLAVVGATYEDGFIWLFSDKR